MRVKQEYLVLTIVVTALLGIAIFVSLKMGHSHYKAMVLALEHGLERVYDEAVPRSSPAGPQNRRWVSSDVLKDIILDEEKHVPRGPIFPSFVRGSDVFLPVRGAAIPSDDFVCVVQMQSGQLYGVAGSRVWRRITEEEFRNWPHESLSTNALPSQ